MLLAALVMALLVAGWAGPIECAGNEHGEDAAFIDAPNAAEPHGIDERLQRLRAMATLAEARREAERGGERTVCRIRHRPIKISAACLENPLARDCM